MYDVTVIGSGPSGSRVAALLARDHDVVVLEEHCRAGEPMQCAGLITDEVIRLSGVRPDVLSTITRVEVVFPNDTAVEVHSRRVIARAVDRVDLDLRMADAAMVSGAEYRFGTRYASHTVGSSVKIETSSGPLKSRLLVGADGHSSGVRASIPNNSPKEYVRGMQADVSVRMERQDMFRIRLGSRLAPGFFTWEIPCGDFTRVGLCCSWSAGPPVEYLKRLLADIGVQDRVIGMHSGRIPLGGIRKIVSNRIMLVGDAACQVKPVSGGGLYPGLTAAILLAETASTALYDDDLSEHRLNAYARDCGNVFGLELDRGWRLRRMFVKMTDDDLNAAGRFVSREDVRSILNEINIDHPSLVVRELFRHPITLLSAIPLMLRCIF